MVRVRVRVMQSSASVVVACYHYIICSTLFKSVDILTICHDGDIFTQ